MLWRGQRWVTPPQLLPKGTWVELFRGWMPAVSEEQTGDTIKGVGASAGQVTAPARVLGGPEDFGQMHPGEVLVAAITTPAWTSLFAMSSAVVTDVGGPLSHSSIVAREYGIPAVLGTAVATRRIRSGQNVRVDGDAGTVTLLDGVDGEDGGRPAGVASEPTATSKAGKIALAALVGVAVISTLARWKRRKRT
jgi:rifampicin phosphotransferase